jgi:FAD-linked oxidoreductase
MVTTRRAPISGAGVAQRPGPRWRNWAGNQSCRPAVIDHPRSEGELVDIVRRAGDEGRRVKAVGTGHSFTAAACTDGHLLDLTGYGEVLRVERLSGLVTVQAGIRLSAFNEVLARNGLAMPNLGDITYQSIAGAVSTATHGTGVKFRNLSSAVVGARIIAGDGTVIDCSPEKEPDLFSAARVGVGALGLLSEVTIQAVPAFNLHALEVPMHIDEVLADLDGFIDGHDHFEFFWFPNTPWAITKRNRRTDDAPQPRGRATAWANDMLISNYVFGATCFAATKTPAAAKLIGAALARSGRSEWTDRSDRVFASARRVRFVEMEYAIPRADFPAAFARLRDLIDRIGTPITFPVECRWVAADDIPLSPAGGRDTAYIAIHVYRGQPYDQYFQAAEAIMNDYGGRPHWGKLHFQSANTLAPRYPRWDEFAQLRRRIDPDGRFANTYTDRVLGPLAHSSQGGAFPHVR